MSYAEFACDFIEAFCFERLEGDKSMGSTMTTSVMLHAFDIKGHETHKYFDTATVNAALGLEDGKGVYGRYIFGDNSSLYQTCEGYLAYTNEHGIQWGRGYKEAQV